ncbi:DGQHR domain-containing protein [Mesorhizobium sp. B2-9-1]|uniref:DGQHR domain-containing protein n=1 Tax=Mesorhizobium sp. B2-9-1 TaxID=2589898 RepID=UPI0015E3D9A5|nr:DGQHR domain-containing protein [Mesorhizobium sp. B2-9-1]
MMAKTPQKPGKGKKAKKPTLSPAEKAFNKLKADHRSAIRSSFRYAGFQRLAGLSDREFTFENQKSDLDDVFVYENVIILAEYTCSQPSGVGEHLKNKKIIYDKILANPTGFLKLLRDEFPAGAGQLAPQYHPQQTIVKIVYCSRYDFDEKYRTNVPGPIYMDYPAVRYFAAVTDAVRKSSRFELMHFMGIAAAQVGLNGKIEISTGSKDYAGSLLPEAHSHFDDGFKIVTFYADPEALLRTAYVLRKDGWRDSYNLYQRMISKLKIEAIRSYLKKQKRVFINNIIVTLPPEVKPLDKELETVDTSTLTKTAAVTIKLPDKPNSIGIIDGQHRVFAYHETADDDPQIAQLRVQQNLLVTGLIYPTDLPATEREKFEARLFLEINSTQTNAKSHLKQAIGLVLDPFASESIATRVLSQLAKSGPLQGVVEQYFFDTNKLKTSSIVSFGLRPLVKTSGNDSLFSIWTHAAREDVAKGVNDDALAEYVSFCVATINKVLIAIRKNLSAGRWTTDAKVAKRVLATTYVNSFLITIRLLIEKQKSLTDDYLEKAFSGIDDFNFGAYHSSQYKRMAEQIVETHFSS